MKVTFVLLVDDNIHNYMRKLSYDIHKEYDTGVLAATLPPHISLKQPFMVEDLNEVEKYFDKLAESILPFEIKLPRLKLLGGENIGILSLEVEESEILRSLHNRINRELKERFNNTDAPFDGDKYSFHGTIALGGTSPQNYRKFYDQVENKKINLSCTAKKIAMIYHDDNCRQDAYITYKILPLGERGIVE